MDLLVGAKNTFKGMYIVQYTTEYKECQAFCPVVRIGSPNPSPASECYSTLWVQGGDTLAWEGGGWGDPIRTTGQKLWCSCTCIIETLYDSKLYNIAVQNLSSYSTQTYFNQFFYSAVSHFKKTTQLFENYNHLQFLSSYRILQRQQFKHCLKYLVNSKESVK